MNKLITAIERTGQQIFDRAFLKVFFLGLATTVGAIVIAYLAANEIMKEMPGYQSDWQWWEDFVNWIMGYTVDIAFFVILFFFFAPISTIFVSIYLDDIVDCVEERYYPENKAKKRLGIPKLAFLATRIMLLIMVFNILVSLIYIILLPLYILIPPAIFIPIGIFYLLNGYLLGWGYYEMVAVRHLGIKEAGVHRRSIRGVVLGVGLIMTFLFMVPIVQLVVPIIGAALICHLFHMSRFEEV